MSATNSFESSLLNLIFVNTNAADIGDATGLRGSTTAGSLFISLHTSDPGETGNQSTNETTYGSYARVAVARSAGGWTVSGTAPTQAVNAATVNWPAGTSGSGTVTHFGIGTASSGTGVLLLKGALSASLTVGSGVTPSAASGQLIITLE